MRFLDVKSDIIWSHSQKQSQKETQIEELGYQLIFEKNKSNNELMDQLIKEKSENMKLFNHKKVIDSKVETILQHNYDEISLLKKEKRRLFFICEDQKNTMGNSSY